MSDKLTDMYNAWQAASKPTEEHSLQCFQGGLTAGAVSMRTRAIEVIQCTKLADEVKNTLLTEVGKLPDIG